MPSFLEKLKKGMGIEITEEEKEETILPKEKTIEVSEKEIKPVEKKSKTTSGKRGAKKIQIEEEEEIKEQLEKVKKEEKVSEKREEREETEEKEEKEEIKETEPVRQGFALKDLTSQEGQLAVDVYQTESEIVIQSAIAGVKPQDLDISIEEDFVSIKGVRQQPAEKEEKNYFYQECFWGPFSRQIILPEETDPSRAEAEMKEGVLTIRIPKIERKKKRKIVVKE